MIETTVAAAGAAPLPVLFERIEALDAVKHAALKLDRSSRFRFAAAINSVPLCLDEVLLAAEHYPIVLSQSGLTLQAVLGCRDRENLFVDGAGRWLAGAYIPAYLRAWPFIAAGADERSEKSIIAIEPQSPHLRSDAGTPLFANGKPTRVLEELIALTSAYRNNMRATGRFIADIAAGGVLHDRGALLKFRNGDSLQLGGFNALDPSQFERLADDAFLAWRKAGWLPALYAMLRSSARWSRLIDIADLRRGEQQTDSVLGGSTPVGGMALGAPDVS